MRYYITDEETSSIEWFHLQEDTEELRKILRSIETRPARMKTEEETRTRINLLHETLAGTYGKEQPFNEERIKARIEEDEWFLGPKQEGEE